MTLTSTSIIEVLRGTFSDKSLNFGPKDIKLKGKFQLSRVPESVNHQDGGT